MEKVKIMLVDDDPDIIKSVQAILENQNYAVVSANNRTDGLKTAIAEKPDLFVLDVMMDSKFDGFDLSWELRKLKEFEKTPIILLTGVDSKTGVNFKSALGNTEVLPVDEYIEKPVIAHILLSKIESLLLKNI